MIKEKLQTMHKMNLNSNIFVKSIFVYSCCILALSCTHDIEYHEVRGSRNQVEVGELLYYVVSEYNNNKKLYKDKLHKTRILPEQSALVLIDVWNNDFLDSLTINHINPLIEEFSAKGSKIIYAPSQEPENENLLVLNDGVHFYDLDTMDSYLQENNIENLFYVGFDTFHCVLDKPNGIFNVIKRNGNLKIFLLEQGVLSFTKEMMESSIALLKKNGVGIIHYDDENKVFPLQTITDIHAKTKKNAPLGNNFVLLFKSSDMYENTALENFTEELNRLEIDYGIVLKNKFYFKGEEISPPDFIKFLRDKEIKNIYYAGSHLNNEILWSDYGVLPLYIKIRYQSVKGLPWPYIINDLAYMTPTASMDSELEKAAILNHYRMIHNINSETLLNSFE
jgi:nicotinamidase-related amidase